MTKRTAAAAAAAIDAASTAPGNSRLAPTAQLQRLGRVIDTACGHARAASDIQAAASVQIDAAEIALNRLLAEIVGVMPVAITPVVAPPRDASGDPAPVRSGVAGSALAA